MSTTNYAYDLSADEPIARVGPGEEIVLTVEDSAGGLIRSREDVPTPQRLPGFFTSPPQVNPVVGPIWIDGVQAGDEVAVKIHRLNVAERGFTCRFFVPRILRTIEWNELAEPETFLLRADRSRVHVEGSRSSLIFPLAPFIGTLALAPPPECDSSSGTSKGAWGGNLDVRDFAAGSTVYLQSSWDGGLLFAGDLHGVQADMEWSASAAEFAGTITLSAATAGRTVLPVPRIETPDRLIALGIDRSMERAMGVATSGLMRWLVNGFGVSEVDAFLHVSINPHFRINVYSNGEFMSLPHTVGAELPQSDVEMHERLTPKVTHAT